MEVITYCLSGLGTEFLDKLYEFVKIASVGTEEDPLILYSISIKCGEEYKPVSFKIRKSKDLFADKIVNVIDGINSADSEDVNRLAHLINGMPGIVAFVEKVKELWETQIFVR